jgi:outer membrane lipoprotein-sorting protein
MNRTRTWQANFVQTRTSGGKSIVKKGRIYYSRPGKLALTYTDPEEIQVAVEGTRVTAFYPARKSAQRVSAPFGGNLAEFLQFSDGLLAAQLLYDIDWANDRSPQYHAIDFTPRLTFPLEPNLKKFRVDYNQQTLLPVGFWLYNREEGWVRYEFSNTEVDKAIDERIFSLNLPANTRVNEVSDLRELVTGLFTEMR